MPLRRYAISLLAPLLILLIAVTILYGLAPLRALAQNWLLLFTAFLPALAIMILLNNVAEEIGWTGFVFARFRDRHSPLRAALLTGVYLWLFHVRQAGNRAAARRWLRRPRDPAARTPVSIRVLIADDQQLVRSGFRVLLNAEPDIEVVGEAADGVTAVAEARRLRPDIVLMDIRMPRLDGIEATRSITNTLPGTRVIILTTYDLDEYVFDALRAGACGFLLKDVRTAELADAVRTVTEGGALLAPTVTLRMISQFARSPGPAQRARLLAKLTPREGEVLELVGHGLSNTEIAARLMSSQATTKTHVARILLKLGLRDRVQAAVLAYERGIVVAGQDNPRMPARPRAGPVETSQS